MPGGETGTPDVRGGRGRRRDLRGRPFPGAALEAAGGQAEILRELRAWAEQEAEDAVEWYLKDKRLKRRGSRVVTALTILLAVAGTLIPLASAISGGPPQGWGYVLLALAAGCKGFDHFFGLSSGWMRDITAAQALRAELNDFRLAWAAEQLRAADGTAATAPDGAAGALDTAALERRLVLLTSLVEAVRRQVEAETAEWLSEFRATAQQLQDHAGPPPGERG
ncbi:SLATT domain-containing protein [Streptomyces sp. WMMC500]|uniref:SLATT domain-containing protein n=1 Tax=Streptomyces sp. WMMC500 TaxID=3015154 RepID=UPI00248BB220|nr:SLATT domain-containing protein [Streptomyces sp. WMMC500]WBB59492.1 SLATT domain-containing protein [Streptomyces sp. WMMC500]